MEARPAPSYEEIHIDSLSSSGEGVARRSNGQVVFVPQALPGECGTISIVSSKKSYARGVWHTLKQTSPHRIGPSCPHAADRSCGGCPLMHADAAQQHRFKEDLVQQALRNLPTRILPLAHPEPSTGYRIRVRFVEHGGILGYQSSRSNQAVAIAHCPVLHPALDRVMMPLRQQLSGHLGDGGILSGLLGESGEVVISITPRGNNNIPFLHRCAMQAFEDGWIRGAWIGTHAVGDPRVFLSSKPSALVGTADAFSQAGVAGHTALPACVVDAVQQNRGSSPWDWMIELHAGAGNFTRWLVAETKQLWAVEQHAAAATSLQKWLTFPHRALACSAEDALRQAAASQHPVDIVVMDPPRTGAAETVPWLKTLRPERIVYVSCDPMTFARDAQNLLSTFHLVSVQPLDLVPQTTHVELIGTFERI